MAPDPRWLEILKASGWQTAAVAAACALFLLIAHWGWLPPLDAWMIPLAVIVFLICSCLAVASVISAALKFFPVRTWLLHWINKRRAKRAVRDYIPHMTERERTIIGYLLAKNQKMFTAASDGGYAPDDVWDVLIEHKQEFPYSFTPQNRDDVEPDPWRV